MDVLADNAFVADADSGLMVVDVSNRAEPVFIGRWIPSSGAVTGVKAVDTLCYVAVSDEEALEGFRLLCEKEGIIPALEPAHAIYYAAELARRLSKEQIILVNLSGRGDKDLDIITGKLETES